MAERHLGACEDRLLELALLGAGGSGRWGTEADGLCDEVTGEGGFQLSGVSAVLLG